MITPTRRTAAGACGLLALASACAGASPAQQEAPAPAAPSTAQVARRYGPAVEDGIARLREVTAPYHTLDSAVAAGYPRDVPQCFADAHHGAMGFHHVNRGFVDARVDVDRPEILLYERRPNGGYALNGVEYIIPFRLWPQDSTPPTVFGQNLKPSEELRIWYLHVWAWKQNPSGLFADWNPSVRCPGT